MSGFRIHPSDEGFDLIVTTKKGVEKGGFPKGVIIPLEYVRQKEFYDYINASDHYVYTAKHLIDDTEFTHLTEKGLFNVFGYYLTDEEIIPTDGKKWCLDACDRTWFRQVNVASIEEIARLIA